MLVFLLIQHNLTIKKTIKINPNINDLKILKKLKVDFVYLPSVDQIYKDKNYQNHIKKSQKFYVQNLEKVTLKVFLMY